MAAQGFVFADPKPSPDNFNTFDPQDVFADSKVHANAIPEKIPSLVRTPPVMKLDEVPWRCRLLLRTGQVLLRSVLRSVPRLRCADLRDSR